MNSKQLYSYPPCWTAREVADYYGCSLWHVYHLAKRGLPHSYVGRLLRFRPPAVKAHIESVPRSNARANPQPEARP